MIPSRNYHTRYYGKSATVLLYIWGRGICIIFALEIMEGGLDYGKWKCADYYRLGSAGA